MKTIVDEFLQLFKEHKLLVAIIAVITVPILYAGMFLWAFWDPYDHLVDLPIAVVNEDEGSILEDENIYLGDELVDNLKEDEQFNFHFVEKNVGYEGLHDEDYYILLEIPNNFSENATTLMDDHPKKLNIIYTPNESYNFLAAQIGETAMLQIESAVQEKITETYAETIFDKIDEVADGLNEAKNATEELSDGATDLQAGSDTLTEHLTTLAEKTVEFNNGISTARSGTGELVSGSQTLASGIDELNDGSQQLLQASIDVQNGSENVANGMSLTNDGVQQLHDNIPSLVAGTDSLLDGLKTLESQLPTELATEINEQIDDSSNKMNAGLTELQDGITFGLTDTLATGIQTKLSEAIADEMIASETNRIEQLASLLLQNGLDEKTVNDITEQVQKDAPSKESLINSLQEQISPQIDGAINSTVGQIDSGFDTYKTEVNNNLQRATESLDSNIKEATSPAFTELINGTSTIHDHQKTLEASVKELKDGTTELQTGSQRIVSGQQEYVNNMASFTSKFTDANEGANALVTGTNSLLTGMFELEDGSAQLSEGSNELKNGSTELSEGIDKLANGTITFKHEVSDAADEVNGVDADEKTFNMMATPVEVDNEKINEVPNYGTGFAPYFLSLGLFVGALLLSIVFPLRDPVGIPKSGLNWFFSKFSVIVAVGILQAVVASGFLLFVLKLEVQNTPLFFLFAIITSLSFITLIQFLVTCLDDPGRFIAIIILILQLTTSAGTFPLELIPKALQPINQLLPMTYSVTGFKAVISSGQLNVMWQQSGILLGFAGVFMLLTASYFIVMYKRKFGAVKEADALK